MNYRYTSETLFLITFFSYPFFAALNLPFEFSNIYFSALRYIFIYFIFLLFLKHTDLKLNYLKIIFLLNLFITLIYVWNFYNDEIILKFIISIFLTCLYIVFIKFDIDKINYNKLSISIFIFIILHLFIYYLNFKYDNSLNIVQSYFFINIEGFRLGTFNLNPISLCIYCLLTFFFFEYSTFKYKILFQFLLIFFALITGSRGPMIAFFLSIIFSSLLFFGYTDYKLLKKFFLSVFLSFVINLVYTFINYNFINSKIYFADSISRLLNVFLIKYNDYANTYRIQIYDSLLKNNDELILKGYDMSSGVYYHNILIESLQLFPLLFISLITILFLTYFIFLNKNFKKNKKNFFLIFLFNFYFIKSLISGFIPREEDFFIFIAIIFSKSADMLKLFKDIKCFKK
jgi:hypothetical protein